MNTQIFKEKLQQEEADLKNEIVQIAIFNTETNQWEATPDADMINETDDNDAADRFEDFEERTSMLNTLQARLNDIQKALGKIESNTFGKCEIGGEDIEEARLAANPAAKTCKAHMN